MIQAVVEIPLDSVQSPTYQSTTIKYKNKKADLCLICGKPINVTDKTRHVQLLTNGNIVSSAEDFENSQGFFPVGNDCAKRLIISFT